MLMMPLMKKRAEHPRGEVGFGQAALGAGRQHDGHGAGGREQEGDGAVADVGRGQVAPEARRRTRRRDARGAWLVIGSTVIAERTAGGHHRTGGACTQMEHDAHKSAFKPMHSTSGQDHAGWFQHSQGDIHDPHIACWHRGCRGHRALHYSVRASSVRHGRGGQGHAGEGRHRREGRQGQGAGGFQQRQRHLQGPRSLRVLLGARRRSLPRIPPSRASRSRRLVDKNGKKLGEAIVAAAKEGQIAEVDYMWPRPGADTTPVKKVSFVTKVGDQVCGVGYYS